MPTKTTLSNIYLENFRGFSDSTEINFGSKITLIFGKGSVGKTTIVDAIELLGRSHSFELDLNPIKNTAYLLSKHNKAKEFTLGFSTSEKEYSDEKNKLKKNDESSTPTFKRAIKKRFAMDEAGVFYPKTVDLFSLSDDPNKFVSLSNTRLTKNITNRNRDLGHFNKSEISFIENEYAWKELYEYTYKFTNELVAGLQKCMKFGENYMSLRSKENEAITKLKKISDKPEAEKIKKTLKEISSELDDLFEASFEDEYQVSRFLFDNPKTINMHINFLKKGKIPYKEYLKYISDDIKKSKKYLYKNNKIYRRRDIREAYGANFMMLEEKSLTEGKESVLNFVKENTTLSEYLSATLTDFLQKGEDRRMRASSKDFFEWEPNHPGKTLSPHAMFNSCNRMFSTALTQIEKVWPGKTGGIYNIQESHADFFTLIDDNIKEINKWMALFGYDFKITLEMDLTGEKVIMLKKDKFKIPITQGGSGAQYLLSFLTTCIASHSKILLLEEPEKALHAMAQVKLAKFFSEQSKKSQIIIETHSENLLLGLLKEIRDKTISNKDVRVIYVYMENKQSKIQDLTINENGSFGSKWKDGFFTEKLDLI